MPDFEDACIAITALEGQCAVIVTRNKHPRFSGVAYSSAHAHGFARATVIATTTSLTSLDYLT
jgi:hypothetical protein